MPIGSPPVDWRFSFTARKAHVIRAMCMSMRVRRQHENRKPFNLRFDFDDGDGIGVSLYAVRSIFLLPQLIGQAINNFL